MKRSRTSHYFLGVIAIFAGIGILFDGLGLMNFHIGKLFPLLIIYLGMKLQGRGKRIIGAIFLIWGCLLFLDLWFGIDIGDLIGFVFSFAIIYLGYRLIRAKKKELQIPSKADPIHGEFNQGASGHRANPSSTFEWETPHTRQSLIGNLFLTGSRWELQYMNIWHGIGEVKIDLSRASIREGETVLVISGWIGDIDIYVPYDLEISLLANINIGDIDAFGNKQGGFNRSLTLATSNFQKSTKRVRIIVNLLIGDIDVKYV